jgi:hypothetical protein
MLRIRSAHPAVCGSATIGVISETVVIDARFRGPPTSANGGYACGVVARYVGAKSVEVSLRSPPPLERPLRLERDGDQVLLTEAETVIAVGAENDFSIEIPERPTLEEARLAGERCPWVDTHPFPECFVCGPARPAPDGLELLIGPLEGRDVFAATWTPDVSLADSDGLVSPLIVWGALDCPTGVATVGSCGPSVLGRLRARLAAPVRAGAPHVVIAWVVSRDGRKRVGGAAISSEDGTLCGVSEGLWIELRDPSGHGAVTAAGSGA